MVGGHWGTRAGGFHCSMSGNSKQLSFGLETFGNQDSTNTPQKLNWKASKNISFTKTLARTNKICSFQQGTTVYLPFTQLPTSTSAPSRTAPSSNTSRPKPASAKEPLASKSFARFQTEMRVLGCTGPSWHSRPIRALRWSSSAWPRVVDGWQQGGGPCRGKTGLVLWSATVERQCVGGAVWPIDCSNIKTRKTENLICIGWACGNQEARVKAFLGPRAIWHTWSMHQPKFYIVTSCKTLLIYPCTKCMYCCYDPTTQLNKLSPIKVWIPEKKSSVCDPSRLLGWPVSCGVNSPNSPATMLSDIQFQSLKPRRVPTCTNKLS